MGFPHSSVGKESTCNAGDVSSIPGKICWRRDRLPTPVFLGSPCGSAGKESACNAGDLGSIPQLGRYTREGIGYPLQCSGLENYTVHGVSKSKTQLSNFHFHQFSSVTQLGPTLCDPMDCSTPGFPVHHQLPEPTQTHVHWVGDAIQLSNPLTALFPPASKLSQNQGLFKWVSSLPQMAKVLEFQLQHQSFQWIFKTDFL